MNVNLTLTQEMKKRMKMPKLFSNIFLFAKNMKKWGRSIEAMLSFPTDVALKLTHC